MIRPNLKEKLKGLIHTGFFFVIISQFIAKIVGFISSILLTRILSKEDYGYYAYAANIISFCLLLDGVGTISSILQHGSAESDETKRRAYSTFGFGIGESFNIVLSIGIFLYAVLFPISISAAKQLLIIMAFQPILSYGISFFSINLRMRMYTRSFSLMNIVVTVINLATIVCGAFLYGALGVVIGTYFSQLICCITYAIVFVRLKLQPLQKSIGLERVEKKSFVKMALSSTCNDAILHLVMVVDLFIIGIMIADSVISASYKVATNIPSALVFIPSSVMVYAFPYFAKHQGDKNWIKKNYFALIGMMFVINIVILAICIPLAPWIITGIFGQQYGDSVDYFRILMIAYFFNGTFRAPTINVLWSQKKNLSVVIVACSMGVVNIVLDILLIKYFQAVGAAYATLFTYIVAALVSVGLFLIYLLRLKNDDHQDGISCDQSEMNAEEH